MKAWWDVEDCSVWNCYGQDGKKFCSAVGGSLRLLWYLIADAFVGKSKHRVGTEWFNRIRDDALCKVYFRRKLEYGNYIF